MINTQSMNIAEISVVVPEDARSPQKSDQDCSSRLVIFVADMGKSFVPSAAANPVLDGINDYSIEVFSSAGDFELTDTAVVSRELQQALGTNDLRKFSMEPSGFPGIPDLTVYYRSFVNDLYVRESSPAAPTSSDGAA